VDFLKVLLRGISLFPSVIQSVESLYGAKTGEQKKDAALSIVTAAINVTDAVTQKTIADGPAFSAGLSTIVDGVVACLNASVWHQALATSRPMPAASKLC
jgi:hypothetical protein